MAQKILVVVDPQNEFIKGTHKLPQGNTAIKNIVKNIEETEYDNYFVTMNTRSSDYCIQFSENWLIEPNVLNALYANAPEWSVIYKQDYGSDTLGQQIVSKLAPDDTDITIDICGLCTEKAVFSIAVMLRTFFAETVTINILKGGCAGKTAKMTNDACAAIQNCGINIIS